MKLLAIVSAVFLVLGMMLYPFINTSDDVEILSGLPWQIDKLPDGSTKVFGVHPGFNRISDVIKILGDDMELAIIAAPDEIGNLEMYYSHYRAGILSGKMILTTDTKKEVIQRWRENSPKSEFMASGQAKKYAISQHNLPDALNQVITSVTFIPSVNLNDGMIITRFGEPVQRINKQIGVTHYMYPAIGLDIALHDEAKEIMQYTVPQRMK